MFQTMPTPSVSLSSHPPTSEANWPIGRSGPSLTPCQSRPLKAPFPRILPFPSRRYGFLLSPCLSPCISRPESICPWNSTNSTSNPANSSHPSSPLHSSHLLDTMACPRLAMPCFASSASNCCIPSSLLHCHSRNSTASSPSLVPAMNRFANRGSRDREIPLPIHHVGQGSPIL